MKIDLGLASGKKRHLALGLVGIGLIAGWLGADVDGLEVGILLLPVGVFVLLTGRLLTRVLVAVVALLFSSAPFVSERSDAVPDGTSVVQSPPNLTVTQISQVAGGLSAGMTKAEVLALLEQPSWAVTSDDAIGLAEPDIPLTLIWRNGNCNPVMVDFDSNGNVTGWDEGRAICGDEEFAFLPEDEFACPRAACEP